MISVALYSQGCKLNQSDAESIRADLVELGGVFLVDWRKPADVYIINSCTVTSVAEKQCRKLIRRVSNQNPEALIIVTGCYAQVAPGEVAGLPDVDFVVGNGNKSEIPALVSAFIDDPVRVRRGSEALANQKVDSLLRLQSVEGWKHNGFRDRTRAFLKVQEGCNHSCSFCVIPMARGTSRSVDIREVVSQLLHIFDLGQKEVVFTGIHLGDYGVDRSPATSLSDLIREASYALAREGTQGRIRIGSLDPGEISDDLIHVWADSPYICPHFHLSLQSCSDEVLFAMNRGYDVATIETVISRIRNNFRNFSITVDMLAGFPGETDQMFAETLSFLENQPVLNGHVFPYSARPGTPAAKMEPVPSALVAERTVQLRALFARKSTEAARKAIGDQRLILVESSHDENFVFGKSEDYLPALLRGPASFTGSTIQAQIIDSRQSTIICEPTP